jgi:hypothetical protein
VKFKDNLTRAQLIEKLDYDPGTGIFTWKTGWKAGTPAGTPCSLGYISIGIGKRNGFKAHRLAWLYVHGCWPAGLIDHIDGNSQNNRIANLREATSSDNSVNFHTPRFNKTGFRGVVALNGKFSSVPRFRGQRFYLGTFDTAAEAHAAYMRFRANKDGAFFAGHNRVPFNQTNKSENAEHERATGTGA